MLLRPALGPVVALTLAVLLLAPCAVAQTGDVFTVAGVPVDETAGDGVTARQKALTAGQRQALRTLMERITLREDHGHLPEVGNEAVRTMVRNFSVEDEKFGGGRYIAKLTVRFDPESVRQLLRSRGIAYAETMSGPLLVLPVYQIAGTTTLWDDPNPWLAAWSRRSPTGGLVPLRLPLGDLSDVTTLSAREALAGNAQRLAEIARKYNAVGTLVAAAQATVNSAGAPSLQVSMTRYGPALDGSTVVQGFDGGRDSELDPLLDTAVDGLIRQLEERWKRDNLLTTGSEQHLQVRVPIGRLDDWLAIRSRLERIAVVTLTEVVRMSTREALVDLHFKGSTEQLQLAVAQHNLQLDYRPDIQNWVLRLAAR